MSPHKIDLPPSAAAFGSYGISHNGFLPAESPCQCLSDIYYKPWEDIADCLPELIATLQARAHIDKLPTLATTSLLDESEWQRAFLLLSAFAQVYIWAGQKPIERLPPAISIPLLAAASHLELQPVASYAALNLWNWAPCSEGVDLTQPGNLRALITFTGTEDESWFFIVSNAMEARAAPVITAMLAALKAIDDEDSEVVIESLSFLSQSLLEIASLLERMDERCDPQVFYHRIRPFLAGSLNDHLPKGVFYDEGNGNGAWRKYRGGSNGQSSLIQFFDAILGVVHEKTIVFHEEMRTYMPGPHAKFIRDMIATSQLRRYVEANRENTQLFEAYNDAVASLSAFRDKHIQLVTRYIIVPSRTPNSFAKMKDVDLAAKLTRTTNNAKQELIGTGGTTLVPFLQQSRDETKAAAVAA